MNTYVYLYTVNIKLHEYAEDLSHLQQINTLQTKEICTKHTQHSICHLKALHNTKQHGFSPPPRLLHKLGGGASLPMGRLTPVYPTSLAFPINALLHHGHGEWCRRTNMYECVSKISHLADTYIGKSWYQVAWISIRGRCTRITVTFQPRKVHVSSRFSSLDPYQRCKVQQPNDIDREISILSHNQNIWLLRTRRIIITVSIRAHLWIMHSASWMVKTILILSSPICLDLPPRDLISSVFSTKILYVFFNTLIRTTRITHLIFHLIALITTCLN
jgi:hypothetical protein